MIPTNITTFVDVPDMPQVHKDERRTIYEQIETDENGVMDRKTRIHISAETAILGNHYHDFDEHFSGSGKATLYTAHKDDPSVVTFQELPASGWELIIPAGVIHAFQCSKDSIIISRASKLFEEGINTHSVTIRA